MTGPANNQGERPVTVGMHFAEDEYGPVVIRSYKGGSHEELLARFTDDAAELGGRGYEPAGQHYVEGSYSWAEVIVAVLASLLFVGLFLLARMATSRPTGTLTVTYLLRD